MGTGTSHALVAAVSEAGGFGILGATHLPPDRLRTEVEGGALMDVGCYCVNLARLVVAAEPVAASASAVWAPGGVDQSLAGTLEFERERRWAVEGVPVGSRHCDELAKVAAEFGVPTPW